MMQIAVVRASSVTEEERSIGHVVCEKNELCTGWMGMICDCDLWCTGSTSSGHSLVLSKLPIEGHFRRIRLRVAPHLENVILKWAHGLTLNWKI